MKKRIRGEIWKEKGIYYIDYEEPSEDKEQIDAKRDHILCMILEEIVEIKRRLK